MSGLRLLGPLRALGSGAGQAATGSVWRTFGQRFAASPPTAAAQGNYYEGVAVGSAANTIQSLIRGAWIPSLEARIVVEMWTRAGGSDPTSTVIYSVYEIASMAFSSTSGGYAVTLGSQVAGSATPSTPAPARGAPPVQAVSSSTFTLDTAKTYGIVCALATADLPASVILSALAGYQIRG